MIEPRATFPDLRLAHTAVGHGRYLPRWEASNAVYHVSCHLADSVPAEQLRIWREERERITVLARSHRRPLTAEETAELKAVFNERIERYLTAGYGACLLRDPRASAALAEVFEHDDGRRYALHLWSIMPNHFHVVVGQLAEGCELGELVAQWKSVASHRINAVLGMTGAVWHGDTYTRIIRDAEEYRNQLRYVWTNPESAGLKEGFARKRYVQFV